MGDISTTLTAGLYGRFFRRGSTSTDVSDQYVIPVLDRVVSYRGRAGSYRTPGLAGTVGQKLFAIHNATGSAVIVDVEAISVDVYQTAARVVAPPILRLHRFTALPTGGASLGKVAEDTTMTSSTSVTLWQAASADGTGVTLNVTIPAASILTQEPVARALTLVGYEQFDRADYLDKGPITLRALEGIVVNLDYTVATSNPTTDMYTCNVRWSEYTRPA